MYAILKQGGHQYRVKTGDVIQIEKIEVEPSEEIELEDILMLSGEQGVNLGEPRVSGAAIKAKVIRQDRSRKVNVYKFKRRKGYERRYGHRQPFTEIRITAITKDGKDFS